jgi:hypothetical protein
LEGGEAKNHRAISGLAAVFRRVRLELFREEKYFQWNTIPEKKLRKSLIMPSLL